MASVGEQLCAAREKQGLTVSQMAERTKLRADHIRELEAGNYDVFAAPVYARGFVRSYATLLRLDVQTILAELEAEMVQSQRLQESTQFSKPAPTFVDVLMLQLSKVKWGITLVVAGIALILYVAVIGYRAWRTHQAVDPLARLGPGLYEGAKTNSGEFLPVTPPPVR